MKKVTLKQIDKISKDIMDVAHSTMKSALDSSYYVADEDIDKLDRMVTAYGKQTGSKFVNHQNFRMLRLSNGIVNMHALRQSLKDDLNKSKQTGNVDKAIHDTKALDNMRDFDFMMKYGADNVPANNFYHENDPEVIPQINVEDTIKDIETNVEQYEVGPDIMYMMTKDFRKNVLSTQKD